MSGRLSELERETGCPILRAKRRALKSDRLPVQREDAVKMSLAALAGMGLSTANVPALAVAASVFLLKLVAKIGIAAVCEGCAEEEAARDKACSNAAEKQVNEP